MANHRKMTENEKSQILVMESLKLTTREISTRIGFSQSAVSKFLRKYRSTKTISRKSDSGMKRKTTPAEEPLLKRISLKDRFKTAVDVRSEFISQTQNNISVETIRRRLRENNLIACTPAKKPLLTRKMRQARLKWARKYENWTVINWRKVMFSDESKFCLFGSEGMQYVRRKPGERLAQQCIRPTVKYPAGQMVWGCFCYHGLGNLVMVESTVNAQVYETILKDRMLPSMNRYFPGDEIAIFQDDSAPCHRTKRVSN